MHYILFDVYMRLINVTSSLRLNQVWLSRKMVGNNLKEHAIRSNSGI